MSWPLCPTINVTFSIWLSKRNFLRVQTCQYPAPAVRSPSTNVIVLHSQRVLHPPENALLPAEYGGAFKGPMCTHGYGSGQRDGRPSPGHARSALVRIDCERMGSNTTPAVVHVTGFGRIEEGASDGAGGGQPSSCATVSSPINFTHTRFRKRRSYFKKILVPPPPLVGGAEFPRSTRMVA